MGGGRRRNPGLPALRDRTARSPASPCLARVALAALTALTALAGALGPGLARATGAEAAPLPSVDLLYQDRPPYYVPQPGRKPPTGLVIAPLRKALDRSGLPHRWVLTPAVRQLQMVESGEHLVCGVGWFRNPAREARGQFSAPVYRGQHLAMIARRDAPLREGMSLREALDSPARLLVKQGYSYGAEFDALIAERPGRATQGSGEVGQLLRQLQVGQADWMPAAPEEVQAQLQRDDSREKTLHLLHFSDPPLIVPRQLYCNKAVPAAWLERLGAALR